MKSGNKNILFTILLILTGYLFSFVKANENNITLDSANTAYSKGDYNKAILLYQRILNKNSEAPELYFNLGNAYYKTNALGLAILNYERAKKLSPQDEDIIVNLKLANQKTEDKIDAAPQLFLTEWKNGLVYLLDEKSWSVVCILLTILSLILFGIYFYTHTLSLKRFGFFGGVVLLISTAVIFFIAQHSYHLSKNSNDGIIVAPSVTVVGSPNEKSTKLFILHEGTKVNITQEEDEWMEIRIANGNVGWLKKKDIIAI